MSMRPKSWWEAACDDCGVVHPGGQSREEAAAAAYAEGWRFPPEVKKDGSASSRAAAVCADCLPTFKGKPATDTWKNRRGKSGDETAEGR